MGVFSPGIFFAFKATPMTIYRENLVSSLPGKASRMFVEIARLSVSTCVLEAEPGKLDIKRHKPGVLFIRLTFVSLFNLAIMALFSIFVLIRRH